jgi:phosphinothricin acetyltransferase
MMDIYNEAVDDRVHANCDVLQTDEARFAAQYFFDPRYRTLVRESPEGEVLGWGALKKFSARPRDPRMAEVAVYIARRSRSAGMGVHLMKELMKLAAEAQFHSLVAIILEKNTPSIRGCKFCGFEEKVRLPLLAKMYGGAEDIVWLQLVLSPSSASADRGS